MPEDDKKPRHFISLEDKLANEKKPEGYEAAKEAQADLNRQNHVRLMAFLAEAHAILSLNAYGDMLSAAALCEVDADRDLFRRLHAAYTDQPLPTPADAPS